MIKRFKYLILFILILVLSQYYLGWVRQTFPPATALLIRLTSGLVLGMFITLVLFRKFMLNVAIDKELPQSIAIIKDSNGNDGKCYFNANTTNEFVFAIVGYALIRLLPNRGQISRRQAKTTVLLLALLAVMFSIVGFAL